MVVYTCGNFSESDDPPDTCPACDSEQRDEQPRNGSTVSVDCPGWYPEDE